MGDETDTVGGFIKETIAELQGKSKDERVFDEHMLRKPLTVLPPREPVIVEPQTSALEAINVMQQSGHGCVLVVRARRLRGIFTERDVLKRIVGAGVDASKVPVRKMMTKDPECLRATDSIAYALNLMSCGGYRHVPIVDSAQMPVGIISVKDIVNYLVSFFPQSIMNLPTLPRGNYARSREGA